MVTLGPSHRKRADRNTRQTAQIARDVIEAARVSRAYLLAVRPGGPAEGKLSGGLKPGEYATLKRSMERVALMSEDERGRFARLKPIRTDGPAHQALKLRIQGMPYWEIAETLGEDEQTVKHWVLGQLQGLRGEEVRNADVARQLQLARADHVLQANWPKAMQGDVSAGMLVLKCMERSSKLLGLDAPQKVDITHRLKLLAEAEGLDYQELLAEANDVIKRLPPAR